MRLARIGARATSFGWRAYLSAALKETDVNDRVKDAIVRQPDYLQALDATLGSTPLSTWKEYLIFGWLNAYSQYLPSTFVNAQFQFFGGVIGGREENRPRWKRGVAT